MADTVRKSFSILFRGHTANLSNGRTHGKLECFCGSIHRKFWYLSIELRNTNCPYRSQPWSCSPVTSTLKPTREIQLIVPFSISRYERKMSCWGYGEALDGTKNRSP